MGWLRAWVAACFVLVASMDCESAAWGGDVASIAMNEYQGRQEREEEFEFAQKPKAEKQGGQWIIAFASKAACDATVAIAGPDGKIVRHLASGVLGKNAPWPFTQGSLSQALAWDGKDDRGNPAPDGCTVRVSLGLKPRMDKVLFNFGGLHPIMGLAVDAKGHAYCITWRKKSPFAEPDVCFLTPQTLGATDEAVYVMDTGLNRLVRLALKYEAEESIPIR